MAYLNFVKPIKLDDVVKKHKRTIQYYTLWLTVYELLSNALKGYEGKVINKRLQTFLEPVFSVLNYRVLLNRQDGFQSFRWELKIEMAYKHESYEALKGEFYFSLDISKNNDRFTQAEFLELTKQQKANNEEGLKREKALRIDEIETGVIEWNKTIDGLKRINETFKETSLEYEFDLSRYKH